MSDDVLVFLLWSVIYGVAATVIFTALLYALGVIFALLIGRIS